MNRVELAISEGRCVLVFGSRALQDAETLGELRRRGAIPSTVLAGDLTSPLAALKTEFFAPALTREGGIICLIEAESTDGAGLSALAAIVESAAHKPRLVVAARAFNPFALPTALRMLKFDHDKKKAKEFLFSLPVPAAAAPVAVVARVEESKKKASNAPKTTFVGREDELATLSAWTGGPMVLAGPAGVGKRWLLEKALTGAKRYPDFHIGWGSEADSLYARIAVMASDAGDKRLAEALNKPTDRPVPSALAHLAISALDGLDGVLVLHHLEHVMRRDGTFHREGRIELLLKALMLGSYKARVLFVSTIAPRFYREGVGQSLGMLELAGLKGRELHEVFDAFRVEDFPREHFGDIHNRIHGHPLAARMFAIAVRDSDDREGLIEARKFMAMDDVRDVEPVKRRITKGVEHLGDEERAALHTLAHFRLAFTASDAESIGIKRETRLLLLGRGLLDVVPTDSGERTFYVHWLVNAALDSRATSDFGILEMLGDHYNARADKASGVERLTLAQEGNRLLFEAHRIRNRYRMPHPDNDPALESVRGMVRGKKPRFDLAAQRITEVLKQDPANSEFYLLKAELMVLERVDAEAIAAVFAEVQSAAPTPECFHVEATLHQVKSSGRGKAASALERGVVAFPDNARLRRRLAGIYVDQNRFDDAVRVLKEAMEVEPMMPDSYGLLGEIYLLSGASRFDDAEAALAEARRLDPENTLHMARLGALLMERAGDDEDRWKQAAELLDAAVVGDSRNYAAHLYLGRLLIERGGDLERADWLLKKAAKLDERAAMPFVERARVALRQSAWAEADAMLDRAIRTEPSCHQAFHARGEMFEAQGHIFNAEGEFRKALERSPKESHARGKYEAAIARSVALIASGAAVELQKAAEAAGIGVPQPKEAGPAVRREPGTTTKRRRGGKGGKGKAEGEAAEAGGPEDAPAEAQLAGGEPNHDGADGAAGAGSAEGGDGAGGEGGSGEGGG